MIQVSACGIQGKDSTLYNDEFHESNKGNLFLIIHNIVLHHRLSEVS